MRKAGCAHYIWRIHYLWVLLQSLDDCWRRNLPEADGARTTSVRATARGAYTTEYPRSEVHALCAPGCMQVL